ncbi:hypothetical protein Tco_0917094 [Tanacetum coccineum]
MTEFPQMDLGLDVPVFTQEDDPIACLNKPMNFLLAVAASRVTVQQVQRRQGQSYVGTGYKGNATSSRGNNTGGQARAQKSGRYAILEGSDMAYWDYLAWAP